MGWLGQFFDVVGKPPGLGPVWTRYTCLSLATGIGNRVPCQMGSRRWNKASGSFFFASTSVLWKLGGQWPRRALGKPVPVLLRAERVPLCLLYRRLGRRHIWHTITMVMCG